TAQKGGGLYSISKIKLSPPSFYVRLQTTTATTRTTSGYIDGVSFFRLLPEEIRRSRPQPSSSRPRSSGLALRGHLEGPARAPPLRDQAPPRLLLLREALGHHLLVRRRVLLVPEHAGQLGRLPRALALQDEGGHEALDLGSATDLLPLLVGERARDDVLAHVVVLGQVEQRADLVGALGPEATGDAVVREPGDGGVARLDHGEVEHGDVLGDDAPPDGLALPLPRAALAVALVALVHEEADAGVGEDALAHGEALLVVPAGDAEDVAGELVAEDGAVDFLGHAALVQVLEALLVVDLDDLLEARGRAGDVDLSRGMGMEMERAEREGGRARREVRTRDEREKGPAPVRCVAFCRATCSELNRSQLRCFRGTAAQRWARGFAGRRRRRRRRGASILRLGRPGPPSRATRPGDRGRGPGTAGAASGSPVPNAAAAAAAAAAARDASVVDRRNPPSPTIRTPPDAPLPTTSAAGALPRPENLPSWLRGSGGGG
ncbi:hypothetical protein ACHAWF_001450, partial [Thalassiosira exigua]